MLVTDARVPRPFADYDILQPVHGNAAPIAAGR
jgi:hypothetical protein